jgi:hypothetical protein
MKLPEIIIDFIVVDEFHHAAAPTYQELLDYFKQKYYLPHRHTGTYGWQEHPGIFRWPYCRRNSFTGGY